MFKHIKKTYFVLLMISMEDTVLGNNPSEDQIKDAKRRANYLFNLVHGAPLTDLNSLYEQLVDTLPANETSVTALDITDAIVSTEDKKSPENTIPEENSSYIPLTEAIRHAVAFSGYSNIGLMLNRLDSANIIPITYKSLGWIRKERDPKFRGEEYGNTKTYENIIHKIKAAIIDRLLMRDETGEIRPKLSATDYDKYLRMMQKHCGHAGPSNFFQTTSASAFTKQFIREEATPPAAHQPTDPSMQPS